MSALAVRAQAPQQGLNHHSGSLSAFRPILADMPIDNPLFQIMGDNDAGPEDAQLEAERDLRPGGDKGARVSLRLPPRLVLYIQGLARST